MGPAKSSRKRGPRASDASRRCPPARASSPVAPAPVAAKQSPRRWASRMPPPDSGPARASSSARRRTTSARWIRGGVRRTPRSRDRVRSGRVPTNAAKQAAIATTVIALSERNRGLEGIAAQARRSGFRWMAAGASRERGRREGRRRPLRGLNSKDRARGLRRQGWRGRGARLGSADTRSRVARNRERRRVVGEGRLRDGQRSGGEDGGAHLGNGGGLRDGGGSSDGAMREALTRSPGGSSSSHSSSTAAAYPPIAPWASASRRDATTPYKP